MASKNKSSDEKGLIDEIKERVAVIQEKEAVAGGNSPENFEPSGFESLESVEAGQKPSILDSLKGVYSDLEGKWYETLDRLDEKFPVYKIIDPIEKFAPSFPIFLGIMFLLAVVGIWLLFSVFFGGGLFGADYSFRVVGEDTAPIEFAGVVVTSGGKDFNAQSDEFGEFKLNLSSPSVKIVAQIEGYLDFEKEMELSKDGFNEIVLAKKPPAFTKKIIQIYDEHSRAFGGSGTITFSCSNPSAVPPKQMAVGNGIISDIPVPENCGTLSYRFSADGYEDCESQASGTTTNCYLIKREQPKGAIEVQVVDADSLEPLLDIPLTLYRKSDDSIVKSKKTVAGGIVLFDEIAPGTYYLSATQLAGYKDVVQSGAIIVEVGQTTKFDLELKKFTGEAKKMFGKLVDKQSRQPVSDAVIQLIVGSHINATEFSSDEEGLFEIKNLKDDSYGLRISHPDYLTTSRASIPAVSVDETDPTVIELEKATAANSGSIQVVVTDSANMPVQEAHVVLKSKTLAAPFDGVTNDGGELLFSNMPPGDYNATADIDGAKGESQTKRLDAGTTLTLEIKLVTARGGLKVIVKNKQAPQSPIPNAVVQIINPSNGTMLQTQTTSETGETPEISLQVGQAVVAQVQKLDGYCTPFTSAPVTIQENAANQITILLEPGNCIFSITFDKDNGVFNYSNGQPATGTLQEPSKYRLKFIVTIPQDVANAKIVVKTGEHAKVSDDPLDIFGTNVPDNSWVGTYYDDCDPNASDVYGDCSISVNVSPTSGGAKKVVLNAPALKSGTYEFSASVNTGDIQTATQDVKVFFGAKAQNKSDGAIITDPTTGLHDATLRIGGALPCSGATCDKFAITTDLQIVGADGSLGAVVLGPGICEPNVPCVPFEVEKNANYVLKARVANLTSQAISNLSLKVSGPTQGGNPYIKLNNSGATVTSAAFPLADKTDAANSIHEETLNITPLIKALANDGSSTGGTFLELSLVGRAEPEADKKRWFNINEEIPLTPTVFFKIGVDPQDLAENQSGKSVAVTALKDSDGTSLQNVSVVMQQIDSGSPDFVAGVSSPISTGADGKATFSGITTRAAGAHVCFQATFQNANAQVACVNVISATTGTFSPANIGCVEVSPSAMAFNLENVISQNTLGIKRQEFTVTTTGCEDKVKLKFSKIDATDGGSIKLLGSRGEEIIGKTGTENEWAGTLNADGDTRRFIVDISVGQCLKQINATVDCSSNGATCPSENTICPGEYRVNVLARFESDAQTKPYSLATNGKISVYAAPGTVEQGYCFNLCTNGLDCAFDSVTNPGATFSLNSSPVEGKAANLCPAAGMPVESSFVVMNPDGQFVFNSGNEACQSINSQCVLMRVTDSLANPGVILGDTQCSADISGYATDNFYSALCGGTIGVPGVNLSTCPNEACAEISTGLTASSIPFEVQNYSIDKTKGGLLSASGYINQASSIPQNSPVQFIVLLESTGSTATWNSFFCNYMLSKLQQQVPNRIVDLQIWTIGYARPDVTCITGGNVTSWDAALVGFKPYGDDPNGDDYLDVSNFNVGCNKIMPGSQMSSGIDTPACADAKAEAWGPALLDLLKNKITWNPQAEKIIQVYASNDPTGAQVDDWTHFRVDYSDPRYNLYIQAIFPYSNSFSNDSEFAVVQKVIQAAQEAGNVKILFYKTRDEYYSMIYWPGGLDEKSDIDESMKAVADGTGGAVNPYFTSIADLLPTALQGTAQTDTQPFHVIFEGEEGNACLGHNGLEGVAGEAAFDSLRRDFDWRWKSQSGQADKRLDFCNPQKFEPAGNNDLFVYCDAVQFQQEVLERILEIRNEYKKPFAEQSASRLGSLQNFSAALIVDGYGADFLEDFKELKNSTGAFGNSPQGIFQNDFDYGKYATSGKFKYQTSCGTNALGSVTPWFACNNPNNVLPFSGIYDVAIGIKFDAGSIGTFLNGANLDPAADITVKLTLKKPIASNNLLYFLPFDGSLGLESSGESFDRKNYGVDYISQNSGGAISLFTGINGEPFETLPPGNSSSALFKVNVYNDAMPGNEKQLFQYLNADPKVELSTRGVVFRLECKNAGCLTGSGAEKEFNLFYTPGKATPVLMELTRDVPKSSSAVEGFYALKVSPTAFADEAYGSALGFNWSGIASNTGTSSCKDFRGAGLMKNEAAKPKDPLANSSCLVVPGISTASAFGFVSPASSYSSNGQKVFLETTIFSPINSNYQISTACTNGQAAFYTMNDFTSPTKASIDLTAQSGLSSYPQAPINSVADMINGVKTAPDGKEPVLCVYNSDEAMEIWFNEDSLRNRLVAERKKSGGPLESITNFCYGQ